MDNETFRLVKTLSTFEGPASIVEIMTRSGLSQGKVLGNLPKLCLAGFVDKRGKQYALTKRGRAVLGELETVSENKEFYFYVKEGIYSGLGAYGLKDFYDIIKTVDLASLEFHIKRHDFENWFREVLRDDELAYDIAKLGSAGVSGEMLRDRLSEILSRNYKMLNMLTAMASAGR